MQKKIKLIWSFIVKGWNGNSTQHQLPPPLVSITGKLFDSTSLLTLDRFIKCACDNDLNQLKVNPSDSIPEITLRQLWETLFEQFLDGVQDTEGTHKTKLIGKINNLKFTYELIQLAAKFLEQAFHPDIIITLSKHIRVSGNFNWDNREEYLHDIQVLLNWAQGIQIDILTKEKEYEMLQAGAKVGEKTTRKQFDQLITAVSIYAKFHIDKRIVTVSEFIEYYTSRRESFEAMEEAYAKQNAGKR
jgi:hypothetical protein